MSEWRAFRPAIWLAMLGVALILVLNPPYIGAVLIGAAVGVAARIAAMRRRAGGTVSGNAGARRHRRPRRR